MPTLRFRLNDDKSRVEVLIERHNEDSADAITAEHIEKHFRASPYANCLPLTGAFQMVAQKLQETLHDEKLQALEVAKRTDAELRILFSKDSLTATAEITQGHGGRWIKNLDLVRAARQAGIVHGLDARAIGRLVTKSHKLAAGKSIKAVIAEGKAPVEGRDTRFEQLADTLEDRVTHPKETEDGFVDVRDYGKYISVNEGQALMRRHPPREGEPGLSVLGKPIPCLPVKKGQLLAGKGTRISLEDSELLIATQSGMPRRMQQNLSSGMAVDEVLHFKTVDLSTGNVEFEGTVMVDKDVAEDMRIIAGGDICVGGLVESSYLQAGGTVFIGKGIIGRQLDDQAASSGKLPDQFAMVIKAGGDIHASYAQSVDLTSDGSIFIHKYLYHSRVHAGDTLCIGKQDAPTGKLIGGDLHVGTALLAGIIGTSSSVPVLIDLSYRIKQEMERKEQLRADMNQASEEVITIATEINAMLKSGMSKDDGNVLLMKQTHIEERERVDQLHAEMRRVELDIEELLPKLRVVATKTLYPGARVLLLDRAEKVGKEHSSVAVVVNEQMGLDIVPMTED